MIVTVYVAVSSSNVMFRVGTIGPRQSLSVTYKMLNLISSMMLMWSIFWM